MSMKGRRAVIEATAKRYQAARKKERTGILNEFTKITAYGRKYAAWILANWKRRRVFTIGGVRTIYVFGPPRARKRGTNAPKRPPTYGADIVRFVKDLWALAGGLCGKRLAPFIRQTVPVLERFEEITLTSEQRRKLLAVSPATIDRLLAPERAKYRLKGRATTKPGTLLKHQIPIRTFADWDEKKPGFMEADLVSHDGGFPTSDVLHSLTMTDVASTWTEIRGLKSKARRWVLEALANIRQGLPFALLGVDCDNGSEFINDELKAYCEQEKLTFTRSRPYRKNDSCFVEQKNYSVVRQAVGYLRLTTDEQLRCLGELYRPLNLFTNYFQPSTKLVKKTRSGSKVKKIHDTPQTPYQRLLNDPRINSTIRKQLKSTYTTLNPAQLRREITRCQNLLNGLADHTKHLKLIKRRKPYVSIFR
jgi:hypothetical protein